MGRSTPPHAATLMLLLAAASAAREKPDLKPLVIREPAVKAEPKFYLDVTGKFGPGGLVLTDVRPTGPLAKMKRDGKPGSTFRAEPKDRVLGIRNGAGRFVVPTSPGVFAAVVNTLPGPATQVLIEDTRGTGAWVYSVSLKPAA
ncbi:MAG: hypothetical protein ACRC33_12415, partial [Gemmataceae bacterium]